MQTRNLLLLGVAIISGIALSGLLLISTPALNGSWLTAMVANAQAQYGAGNYGDGDYGGTIPIPSGTLLTAGATVISESGFAGTHPSSQLFEGCENPACADVTAGSGASETFTVELDLGQSYDVTTARLFGDDVANWNSRTWTLQYKQGLADSYQTAFSSVDVFGTQWFTESVNFTGRYIRMTVTGTSGSGSVEVREIELYGTAAAVQAPPVIALTSPVSTPTTDTTPNFTFSSDKAGTIAYSGSCDANITTAIAGLNQITLQPLSIGTYSNCGIRVTDAGGNDSNILSINTFEIVSPADTTPPVISEVNPVDTPDTDQTPNYTFTTNESGTILYGGSCSASDTTASVGNNTVTFNSLSPGTYTNCTIRVRDAAGNQSLPLSVSAFTITPPADTTAPSLSEVTPVATPNSDRTPNYTFNTDEAGTILYGGSCSASDTTASVGNNTVTFNSLSPGTYTNCTIRVRDAAGNTSVSLNVSDFTITSPPPANTFQTGDHIRVQSTTNVYAGLASLSSAIGQIPAGAEGYVTVDEADRNGETWVRVNFKRGRDGYVNVDDIADQPTPNLPGYQTEKDNAPVGDAIVTLSHRNETDINSDGIDDREEERVATLRNKMRQDRDRYNTLTLSGDTARIVSFRNRLESEVQNEAAHDYPLGLFEFSTEVESGSTETVTLYLDEQYDTSEWQYRKYNPTTGLFTDISSEVTYGTATVDGDVVTTVTYAVEDNGPLDTDNRLGYIADPAGPSTPVEETVTNDDDDNSSSSGGSSGGGGGGGGGSDDITADTPMVTDTTVSFSGEVSEDDTTIFYVVSESDRTPNCRDDDEDEYSIYIVPGTYDEDSSYSLNVAGLTPETTYYYRVCGEIDNDDFSGDRDSFTTLALGAAPPIATTPASQPTTNTPAPVNNPVAVTTAIPTSFSFDNNISFIQPSINITTDVMNLQRFLNDFEGESLTIDGVYGNDDNEAIKRFQRKYQREILDVWNLTEATGYVGITTRLKMNFLLKGQVAQCPVFTEYNGGISPITNSPEIGRTQEILRDLDMYNGPINNIWTPQVHEAMIVFQETFREVMLDPWSITEGTGYKYKTTNKFLNYFAGCDTGAVYLEGVGTYEGI